MSAVSKHPLVNVPVLVIKGAACTACMKISSKLNRCKACKRVFYCSAECQKKDWKEGHKALCPALCQINTIDSGASHSSRTWDEYRSGWKSLVAALQAICPSCTHNNQRLLTYQPHCGKCHRSLNQLSNDEKLYICNDCKLAHHCTSCNSSESPHKNDCTNLQEISKAEAFSIQHYLETGESFVQMPTIAPRETYLPLSEAKSWYDYYTEVSDKTMVKGLLSPDLKPLAGNEDMSSALRAATLHNSIMLTIIAGLEAVFPDLAKKTHLTLHLIGAQSNELDALMLFEELLHLLPTLQTLHCVFIGIELPNMVGADEKLTLDCCPDCTTASRTRSIEMYTGAYHNFATSPKYSKPDLAIALQSGHAEEAVESWTPTIRLLARAEHATVFTCWNEKEMRDETNVFEALGVRFVVKGQVNRWKGLRPYLEVGEEKENSIYYPNYYWYVIAGRGS